MEDNKQMRIRGMIRIWRLGLMFGLAVVMAVPSAMAGFAAPKEAVVVKAMSSLDMAAYVDELDEGLNPEESLDASTLNGANAGMNGMDFTTRRLILLTDMLEQDYGASEILKYEGLDTYLLQYETEAEAAEAYYRIVEDLGVSRCFPDAIVPGEALADWKDARDYPNVDARNAKVVSWGTDYMGMDQLRLNVQNDNKVCVAIIDTGLDVQNPFFVGRTISKKCYNFGTGKKGLKNMFDTAKEGYDSYGSHGTHVAGIIVDATPSNVELLPLRVVFGDSPISQFISAMDYAVENGADVVNCSFEMGDYGYGYGPLDEVLEKAKKNNVIVVAAAGNNSVEYVSYPGSSSQTVAVSSLDTNGQELANYSDWGDRIDFTAPGTDIFSAWDQNRNPNEYIMMSGTSMATPEITAGFAYLKMLYPKNS